MSGVKDIINAQNRYEAIEEGNCADNICQHEVRKKYLIWNSFFSLLDK